jgi:hypothetical protein
MFNLVMAALVAVHAGTKVEWLRRRSLRRRSGDPPTNHGGAEGQGCSPLGLVSEPTLTTGEEGSRWGVDQGRGAGGAGDQGRGASGARDPGGSPVVLRFFFGGGFFPDEVSGSLWFI